LKTLKVVEKLLNTRKIWIGNATLQQMFNCQNFCADRYLPQCVLAKT